jgi:hypothetical protein
MDLPLWEALRDVTRLLRRVVERPRVPAHVHIWNADKTEYLKSSKQKD